MTLQLKPEIHCARACGRVALPRDRVAVAAATRCGRVALPRDRVAAAVVMTRCGRVALPRDRVAAVAPKSGSQSDGRAGARPHRKAA